MTFYMHLRSFFDVGITLGIDGTSMMINDAL